MNREIITYPINSVQMKDELSFLAEYFQKVGYEYCEVLFGFAWGNEYYDSAKWEYEKIPLNKLVEKVIGVETNGFGEIGTDDLFIKVQGLLLEFRFCNDSDIHLSFDVSGEISEYFYNRWKSLGYLPAEWLKDNKGKPSKRLRLN